MKCFCEKSGFNLTTELLLTHWALLWITKPSPGINVTTPESLRSPLNHHDLPWITESSPESQISPMNHCDIPWITKIPELLRSGLNHHDLPWIIMISPESPISPSLSPLNHQDPWIAEISLNYMYRDIPWIHHWVVILLLISVLSLFNILFNMSWCDIVTSFSVDCVSGKNYRYNVFWGFFYFFFFFRKWGFESTLMSKVNVLKFWTQKFLTKWHMQTV